MEPHQNRSQGPLTMPGAIIIAGALIAVAIIWTQKPATAPASAAVVAAADSQNQLAKITLAPVTSTDHVLGNPNAPVKIVEYSDPSCPFCKLFFPIMQQVMNDYGSTGKVAWIYRAFPLDQPDSNGNILHPNAGHESQALECAASLGGNTAFWAYASRLYSVTPSVTPQTPQGLDQTQLPVIAKYVGLDPVAFNDCLASGQFKDKVDQEYQSGIAAGVSGTPYTVIITPAGNDIPLVGSQSYATMKSTIDALLSSGTAPAPTSASGAN